MAAVSPRIDSVRPRERRDRCLAASSLLNDAAPGERHALFSPAKYGCKKATLQLSSYVVVCRIFHIMRRRFTVVFVVSKALNHLQLSLTIARIC
ncbi:protein of unknown function [Burkholderia multivorans]